MLREEGMHGRHTGHSTYDATTSNRSYAAFPLVRTVPDVRSSRTAHDGRSLELLRQTFLHMTEPFILQNTQNDGVSAPTIG